MKRELILYSGVVMIVMAGLVGYNVVYPEYINRKYAKHEMEVRNLLKKRKEES